MLSLITSLDTLVYLRLNRFHRAPRLISGFRYISHSGDGHLYVALAGLVWWLDGEVGLLFIQSGLTAFVFEIPGFMLLKSLIKRDRPFVAIADCSFSIQPSDKFSMPSGHTAAAFLMATVVSGFYPGFAEFAFAWATAIGASRVVLGVHYPGDILAGAALGSGCAITGMALTLPV